MPGASTVVPSPLSRGGPDADDPSQGAHHPRRSGGDRPLRRAHGRSGPPLWRFDRDHPQVAQAWRSRLPGPLQPSAQVALEGNRRGARHCVRPAPCNRLPRWMTSPFPLDDLTFVVTHFLPHLNRDAVYRILKAEGLGRLPPASRPRKPDGPFKVYDVGFVHVDVKHLPKLRTADGQSRKRYLYVAIDRASRFVHLA